MVSVVLFSFLLVSFSESIRPSNETCYQNIAYSTRDYLKEEEVNGIIAPIPLLLMSYPGAGSTFTRLLLEYGTGLYTGSIYTDGNLAQLLPGERFCGLRLAGSLSLPLHSTPFLSSSSSLSSFLSSIQRLNHTLVMSSFPTTQMSHFSASETKR